MRPWIALGGVLGSIALGIAAAAFGVRLGTASADVAVMSIDPPSQNVPSDSASFTVSIKVTGANNVGAWEFAVKYNPDVLDVVDVSDRGYLAPLGLQTFCQRGGPPRWSDDVVDFSCGAIGGNFTGQSGDGELATITFHPKKTGSSDLVFMKRTLSDPLGPGLPLQSTDGIVSVVDPGQSGGSLQATPTPNVALLTPTAVPSSQSDPLILTPAAGGNGPQNPGSGSGSRNAAGVAGSSTNGVGTPGSNPSSPSGVRQLPPGSGESTGASSGASGDPNFPHAGTGPESSGRDARWNYAIAFLFAAGLAVLSLGWRKLAATSANRR